MLKFIPRDSCDELELHEALMSPLPIPSDVEFFRLNKPLTEDSLLQALHSTSTCAQFQISNYLGIAWIIFWKSLDMQTRHCLFFNTSKKVLLGSLCHSPSSVWQAMKANQPGPKYSSFIVSFSPLCLALSSIHLVFVTLWDLPGSKV